MILVTGTDTGVGKTFVTVSLLSALRKAGVKACAFKLVETGCNPICEDARKLSEACDAEHPPVYSFKEPLAPAVAGELEGKEVSPERIKRAVSELAKGFEVSLFEGAGGLLVPITWNYTFLDLAKELSMDVVVVALNKLGVINHTLLTIRACECAGVRVKGVVLNTVKRFDESVETNHYSLRRLLPVPVYLFTAPDSAGSFARELLM